VNDGIQSLSTTSSVKVDRAPVANNATGFDVIGTTLVVPAASGVLANDTDLDNDALTVSAVNGSAANVGASVNGTYGHLTLSANGGYSYVANNGAVAGNVDSFTYTVSDGNGGTATATLQVTLDTLLQAFPLAVLTPVGQATPATWTLPGSGGQGALTFALVSQASHGTAVVNTNGTFTYTPGGNYSGADSFQFRVTDALGQSSSNLVSLGVGSSGYSVAQSLQLMASQHNYLTQTPAAAGNQRTWTWSGWVDAGSNGGVPMDLFTTTSGSGSSLQLASLRLNANNQIEFYDYSAAAGYSTYLQTSQQFSANAWHNVVLVYDTTQAVATNRARLYVDGQQIASFATQTDPAQNAAGLVNSTAARYLGFEAGNGLPNYLNGNLADVQFIDGLTLSPSALGQLVGGVWKPVAYTGSYGAQGYHLPFASGAIGTDVSGDGNNWTPVNLSNANVSSQTPGGSPLAVTLTLDNGLPFNNGSTNQITGGTVRITGGFAGDLLSVGTSGTNITTSWNAATETLTLSGTDTAANYQTLLDTVAFSSSASDPTNGGANTTRTVTWQVTDITNATTAPQTETIDLSPTYSTLGHSMVGTTSEGLQGEQGGVATIAAPPTLGFQNDGASPAFDLGKDNSALNVGLLGNYIASFGVPSTESFDAPLPNDVRTQAGQELSLASSVAHPHCS